MTDTPNHVPPPTAGPAPTVEYACPLPRSRLWPVVTGWVATWFNALVLLVGALDVALAADELKRSGEQWGLIVVFLLSGVALLAWLFVLTPLTLVSVLVRPSRLGRRSRWFMGVVWVLALAANATAIAMVLTA